MKEIVGLVLGIILVVALVFGLAIATLGFNRVFAPFAEETRRQVYDTSRAYQQGTQRTLARYCRDWRTSADAEHRAAIAALIRDEMSTYNGPISADVQSCLEEVQ